MVAWVIVGALGLGGLVGYLWWQQAALAPGSLARRAALPPTMALRKSTVVVVAGLVLVACLGTVYLVRAYWPKRSPARVIQQSHPPGPGAAKAAFLESFPKEYAWTVKPEPKPLPPKGVPVTPEPGTVQAAIPPRPPPPTPVVLTREEVQAMLTQMQAEQRLATEQAITRALAIQASRQPAVVQPMPVGPGAPAPVPGTATAEPKDKRWFAAKPSEKTDVMAPPFAVEEHEGDKGKESKLFQPAVWEQPADPTKILYADQVVHGLLMQNVNSDIPGTVRIKVSEDVKDRWGQGHVLLPMDTTFVGKQEGTTAQGQTLIPITVGMAILPSGAAILFDGGQVGDAGGATGLPGDVNGHYGKLVGGALLSALVNIGVRAPFGSTQGYNPSLSQEYSKDAANSLGQSMQEILKRELATRPTITQKHSYPVTVAFTKNVSFQTGPTIVKK